MTTSRDSRRVLYIRDGFGVHDRRFVDALRAAGHEVQIATRSPYGHVDWAAVDVVQIGPLPLLAAVDVPDSVPVVATCWGRDAFEPLGSSVVRLRRAAVVICDCRAAAERLVEHGVDRGRIVSFPWGIDLGVFHLGARGEVGQPGSIRLVSTRALDPFYRHDLVLRAVAALHVEERSVSLDLYGAGPDEAHLVSLVEDLGLSGVAAVRSPVEEADLAAVLRGATAWVNAAPLDGICISLLQAAASGCAIVTPDLPCAREAAGPVAASFFPVDDLDALTAALRSARRPGPEAAEQASRWVASYADWQTNAAVYVDAVEMA